MTQPKCKTYHYRDGELVSDIMRPGDKINVHVDGFGTITDVGNLCAAGDICRAVENAYKRGRRDKMHQIAHVLSSP